MTFLPAPRHLGGGVGFSQEKLEREHFFLPAFAKRPISLIPANNPLSDPNTRSTPPDLPPPLMQDFVTPQNGTHPKQSIT
jgi:hypothetical protein